MLSSGVSYCVMSNNSVNFVGRGIIIIIVIVFFFRRLVWIGIRWIGRWGKIWIFRGRRGKYFGRVFVWFWGSGIGW